MLLMSWGFPSTSFRRWRRGRRILVAIEDLQPEHALLGACPSLLMITRDEAIYERTLALDRFSVSR